MICVIQSPVYFWFLFSPHLLSTSLLLWVLGLILLPCFFFSSPWKVSERSFHQGVRNFLCSPSQGHMHFRKCWEGVTGSGSRASRPGSTSYGTCKPLRDQQVPLSLSFLICIMRLLMGACEFYSVRDSVPAREMNP